MPFISDIVQHRSVAIVGMAKNVGKTECLNYVLRRLHDSTMRVAITSIGLDGESRDRVSHTEKPEVTVYEGMMFVTTEQLYRQKRLVAEILDVGTESTALGRLVTARAVTTGKALISGSAHTKGLRSTLDSLASLGAELTLVDGALSRLSLASPAVTDALVLATGAALSANIPQLVSRTRHVVELIGLGEPAEAVKRTLEGCSRGIWVVDRNGELHEAGLSSSFLLDSSTSHLVGEGAAVAVYGAVTDRLLSTLTERCGSGGVTLIAADFSRLFVSPEVLHRFIRKGGEVKVLQRSKLVAVCINPTSPEGYTLDSALLRQEMEQATGVPVYDVRNL